MLNILNFGNNVEIKIDLEDPTGDRRTVDIRGEDGHPYTLPIYVDSETISGSVTVVVKRDGKLDHQGIHIDLCGVIEFYADRGGRDEFVSVRQDLARPGIISQKTTYPFEFLKAPLPFESYMGSHVNLRYYLRVVVHRRWGQLTHERPLMVYCATPFAKLSDEGSKMEVGIEDSLHIEVEYNKQQYHLHDVIVGKVYFMLVRVKIKNMELQLIKRETIGGGLSSYSDAEALAKYEIMEGAPVRGEWIPIRLFLSDYPLSPTFRDVNRKFSVRYFINLIILDEEDRRYYKQQEISLYRSVNLLAKINQLGTNENANLMKTNAYSVQPSDIKDIFRYMTPDKQPETDNHQPQDTPSASKSNGNDLDAHSTKDNVDDHPDEVDREMVSTSLFPKEASSDTETVQQKPFSSDTDLQTPGKQPETDNRQSEDTPASKSNGNDLNVQSLKDNVDDHPDDVDREMVSTGLFPKEATSDSETVQQRPFSSDTDLQVAGDLVVVFEGGEKHQTDANGNKDQPLLPCSDEVDVSDIDDMSSG